jgi:hypothetical protein
MTESDIPRVNKPSRDRHAELSEQWKALNARGIEIIGADVASFNEMLISAGIGPIWAGMK